MDIRFTKHAHEKFHVLARHGVKVTKNEIKKVIREPEKVDTKSRQPQIIFQRTRSRSHVLRVVCKKEEMVLTVVTFYPGRKSQYGE